MNKWSVQWMNTDTILTAGIRLKLESHWSLFYNFSCVKIIQIGLFNVWIMYHWFVANRKEKTSSQRLYLPTLIIINFCTALPAPDISGLCPKLNPSTLVFNAEQTFQFKNEARRISESTRFFFLSFVVAAVVVIALSLFHLRTELKNLSQLHANVLFGCGYHWNLCLPCVFLIHIIIHKKINSYG